MSRDNQKMKAQDDVSVLVRKHQRFAYFVARRVAAGVGITSLADIEDLEQEALIGLWRAAQTWDPKLGAFSTWAGWKCRAAAQRGLRNLRSGGLVRPPFPGGSKHKLRVLSFEEDPWLKTLCDDPWSKAAEFSAEECRFASIEEALSTLSHSDRELFEAYWLDGVSGQDMARSSGVSRQAVSKKLIRAMGRVRNVAASIRQIADMGMGL